MKNYYPLAFQNTWKYKQKDGSIYENSVIELQGNVSILLNSATQTKSQFKIENDQYFTDAFEAGVFQLWLDNHAKQGDQWEVKFTANGIKSILIMTVKQINISKEVEGKSYSDVIEIEAESKMEMNGNIMSLNFFTNYFYASEIGLILTTSSYGDYHGIVEYTLH